MTGQDIIDVALRLATDGTLGEAEARHRSAASRAYFGAYQAAVEFYQACGATLMYTGADHAVVHETLTASAAETNDAELAVAAGYLGDLRTWRKHADYDDKREHSARFQNAERAERDVRTGSKMKAGLDRCLSGTSLATIKAAVLRISEERKTEARKPKNKGA